MDLKFCKCVIRKFSLFPAFYLKIKVKELPAMNSQGNPVSLYGNEAQALRYIAIIIFAYSNCALGKMACILSRCTLHLCTCWQLGIWPVLGKLCWPYYHLWIFEMISEASRANLRLPVSINVWAYRLRKSSFRSEERKYMYGRGRGIGLALDLLKGDTFEPWLGLS